MLFEYGARRVPRDDPQRVDVETHGDKVETRGQSSGRRGFYGLGFGRHISRATMLSAAVDS